MSKPSLQADLQSEFFSDLQFALRLADAADAISMERFRANDLVVTIKPDMTPVSDADRTVEQVIRALIQTEHPEDSVVGEEFGTVGDFRRQWIIDPIDGTKNYVRGVPIWATLIALAVDGVPVLGVVSAPALGRRWWAAHGEGAWARGDTFQSGARRLQVSAISAAEDASGSFGSASQWERAGQLEQYLSVSRTLWRTRDYGDMWPYMMIAEGVLDIAAEFELFVYDMAALIPIVTEAGGTFTSIAGEAGPWHNTALATNGHLHAGMLRALNSPNS